MSVAISVETPRMGSWLSHKYPWKLSEAQRPKRLTRCKSSTAWYIAVAPPMRRLCEPISPEARPAASPATIR